MARQIIKRIYSGDRQHCVSIFRREDGTFGFSHWSFADDPHEQCWIPTGAYTESFCASEDIVLREAIGRVAWLEKMVARFEDVDGLPRRVPSGPPPNPLNGAAVICFTLLDHRHHFTENCRQIRHGVTLGPASALAICQFPNEACYYLFGCDADWHVVGDTWHPTIEGAKQQAELEYSGATSTWQQIT